jgi:uncharacterized damage-inducible protein DinB
MEIREIVPFLEYLESIRNRTRRVVACIPSEKMEWTHQPGRWTFGDLVRHLGAIERWMFVENAMRRPSRYPGHGPDVASGYTSPLAYLDAMHMESLSILRELTPADLRAKCVTPGGVEIVVWKWLRAMIEHEVHHRGQIHLMLSMLGVSAPPLYGLTEEEVHHRSRVSS